ncbi:MAG: hypothetical protein RIR18_760 [Pseudomonadota bacterium]|jgi:dihydrofolate reductase
MALVELVLIAAVAKNRVIGVNNQLPWHLPEDLKHFRELTRGCPVIMGRKTWESLPAAFRPLPGRRNIVLTRQEHLATNPLFQGAELVTSLPAALSLLGENQTNEPVTAFVMGGADIYRQAMPLAHRLEITEVDLEPEGDAWFPEIDPVHWIENTRTSGPGFDFVSYRRQEIAQATE